MPNKYNKLALGLWLAFASQSIAAEAPPVLSRDGWQAKPPTVEMQSHKPSAILVHHTGAAQSIKATLAAKMRGLQRFSQAKEKLADGRMKPAWPDVPYHYYIAVDGKIAEGRNIKAIGDTNTAYDPSGFIQVVVEGNFETEKLNDAQTTSLKSLLKWLMQEHKINADAIQAHNEKTQTACPGKDLAEKLPGIVAGLK